MTAEVIAANENEVVLQVKVKLNGSLMEMEEAIQLAVNEVGSLATHHALKKFDTMGAPIQIGSIRMTSKGEEPKRYETPYGAVDVPRHVYQTSKGGKTYCPLDERARIITSSTPRFAMMISHKYTQLSARELSDDLQINHGRPVSRAFLQDVVDVVGSIAQTTEEDWMYEIPPQDERVATVSLSLDGTCILMRGDGYREAMAGTVSLYNQGGERLHTIYLGASPEYGKLKFLERLERTIYHVRLQYPDAKYVGIADGAKVNWDFLDKHTECQILDFFHATEYLSDVARAVYPSPMLEGKRKDWLYDACHRLKHYNNAALDLLDEMKKIDASRMKDEIESKLKAAITYFTNQAHRMNYDQYRALNLPIGSGVTEAACKTLVKQRLCRSGMKWKDKGASLVLRLRALVCTKGCWEQFWERINQAGLVGLGDIK